MKKVLTIDDSKVVRSMVARALAPYGCEVIEAEDGEQGLAAAREHTPDLVLLDITMPVLDGRETLRRMREDEACRRLPVLMMTAETGKETVLDVARLGVAGYIVKPFRQETFDKEVRKILGEPAQPERTSTPDPSAVLVVDDSERVLAAARAALEEGLRVLTAASGNEALERYREAHPGVVVLDLVMPEMDGFETLDALRQLGGSSFVALGVRGDEAARQRALKAGCVAVVDKPFRPEELRRQVESAADAVVSPEEVARSRLAEIDGCPVFSVPDGRPLGRLLPPFARLVRDLAEAGNDRLIIDLGERRRLGSDDVGFVVRMMAAAEGAGLRTAVCSPDESLTATLRQVAEASDAVYASSREAAREGLS